jgi:DNA-binding transcriptional LysR family regulator
MSDSLEFRLLKYIVAVAETSNFTRAAERLFLAQPSLSKQIRDLEEEIRFPIFDRSRDGVRVTLAGEMIVAYAKETLKSRDELVAMARAVHLGEVPPLRLGFSSFVTGHLLQSFRDTYCGMFPGCDIKLTGGDPAQVLQRINQCTLDCAILPMPVDIDVYHVQQISQSPLVICMRSDDPLAQQSQLDVHEIADRIKIFRDPELQPSAHSRLVEMFAEVGIPMHLACSANTPADMQWMVKAGYGLALIDQAFPLDAGLTSRPIAGVKWTADIAFVHHNRTDHISLPFIERSLTQQWRNGERKKRPDTVRPEQLKLLA